MRNNFYVTANCVLANGTSLTLTKDDFYLNGNGYVDASDSSDFPLGVAVEKTSTLTLVNDDDRFTDYNFNAARITIFINDVSDDGTTDVNRVGTFVVSKKPATTEKINLTLLDHMSNADKTYTSNLIFPATAREVLMDACQTCGIMLTDTTFKNNNYTVNQKPENTTFRAVIGYVAMLAGGNARIDNNDRLRIVSFQKPIGDGSSSQNTSFKKFTSIKNLTYDTDDVIVTGVSMTEDDQTYLYGEEGYVLAIDNPLISGDIENGLALIGSEVVGLKMRPFSCSSIAYPYASFLDPIYVEDTKGREYFSYLTDIDFSFTGYTELSNNVKSAEENIKEYSVGNSVIVNQLKKEVEESMSAYDVALENLNNMAANTLGYYATLEKQPDGSFIAYQHDQPKLEDSTVIYKRGIDGFFISRDGGKTYIAGFDSEGNAVLNILYAIGIQSEWINTRGFTAKDNEGNITFRIDAETGKVEIVADSFSLRGTDIDQYIDNKIDSYSPLTVQLTNEFAGVPTDANGGNGNYSECYTEVKVYMGNTNITENEDVAYTVNPSSGVIGNWNVENHRYTVTGMTTDTGNVSFTVTYSGLAMSKQFSIAKIKQSDSQNYTWIKYADTPTSGMSDDPYGKSYLGIAYNKTTPTESTDYSDYEWSLIKGEDGVQGPPGENGETLYTWIKYADTENGDGMNDLPESNNLLNFPDFGPEEVCPGYTMTIKDQIITMDVADGAERPEDDVEIIIGETDYEVQGDVLFGFRGEIVRNGETDEIPKWVEISLQSESGLRYSLNSFGSEVKFRGNTKGPIRFIIRSGWSAPSGETEFRLMLNTSDNVADPYLPWEPYVEPKKYIGIAYNKTTPTESDNPDDYTWSLFRGADGINGENGVPGRTYFLSVNPIVVSQATDGAYNPSTISVGSFYRDGDSAERTAYNGTLIFEESENGSSFIKTGEYNFSQYGYTIQGEQIKAVRITMCVLNDPDSVLDMQTVTIVRDQDNLTQEEIFNILTNNGQTQGIYMQDGKLYLNASYIGSGAITIQTPDGERTFYANTETGEVNINATSLKISGKTIEQYIDDGMGNLVSENLLKDTQNFTSTYWAISGSLTRNLEAPDGTMTMASLKATNSDSYLSASPTMNKPIVGKGNYTFNVWLKATSSMSIDLSLNHTDGVRQRVYVNTDWQCYSLTCEVTDTITDFNQVTIGGWGSFTSSNSATLYIWKPSVTIGYSQEEIFNALTNNGAVQGIYLENGQLYINASYINSGYLSFNRMKGGTLILGGSGNTFGNLEIRNGSRDTIGSWNEDGIFAENANITGVINGTSGHIGNWTFTENGLTSNVRFNEIKVDDDSGLVIDSTNVKYQVQLLKYGVTQFNGKYIAMIVRARGDTPTSSFLQKFAICYDGTIISGTPSGTNMSTWMNPDGTIQFKRGSTTLGEIEGLYNYAGGNGIRINANRIFLNGTVIEPL